MDVTRSVLELSVEPSGPSVPRAREVERIGARALTGEKAWKVDRRPVTFDEDQAARAILAEWNAVTGQRLESRDWLAKIVMRVRERPELSIVDHGRLIRATLEAPWWKGSASPSVVYGNGAVFERALTVADETPGRRAVNGRAPKRYGRGMTTREILERTGSS